MGPDADMTTLVIEDAVVSRIVHDLVRVKLTRHGSVISTPVLFPSGGHVSVTVVQNGDNLFISDDGAAFAEADLMGASEIFKRTARQVAQEYGVQFNSFEIFEATATVDTAAGMIAIVADAARRSVQITAERLGRRVEMDFKAMVVDRLREVFGKNTVSSSVEMSGASTHQWTVDAVVKSPSGLIAVEAVSPSPVSVSSAYVKLDDLRRLEGAPKTVAALKRKEAFRTDQIMILSRTAHLLDASGPNAFARLAA